MHRTHTHTQCICHVHLYVNVCLLLQVLATDVPTEGEAVKTGEAQVTVTVMDVNDNAPEITQPGVCQS